MEPNPSSKFITDAHVQKSLDAQFRSRGHHGNMLTLIDPETPLAAPPPIPSPTAVRELRDSLGVTQAKFAEMLGVHVTTVKKYESENRKNHRSPSRATSRLIQILRREPKLGKLLIAVPLMTGPAIQHLRRKGMQVSQSVFANWLGVSVNCVSSWEGLAYNNNPCPTAARLLYIALEHSELLDPSSVRTSESAA